MAGNVRQLSRRGAAVSFAGAALTSRALATLLIGVSRLDPITYLAVLGMLGCVAVCACALPAWRAARVDPSIALRAEQRVKIISMSLDPGLLFLSLITSGLGLVLFTYGKKQERYPQVAAGIALMVYPYFVPNLIANLLVGAGIVGAMWIAIRQGW